MKAVSLPHSPSPERVSLFSHWHTVQDIPHGRMMKLFGGTMKSEMTIWSGVYLVPMSTSRQYWEQTTRHQLGLGSEEGLFRHQHHFDLQQKRWDRRSQSRCCWPSYVVVHSWLYCRGALPRQLYDHDTFLLRKQLVPRLTPTSTFTHLHAS